MKKLLALTLLLSAIAIIPMACGGDEIEGTKAVYLVCLTCNGSGTCQVCNGTGKVDSLIYKVDCSSCKGKGKCAICSGKGHVVMRVPKDMDSDNFSRCGTCNGHAYCPRCNGTGKVDSLVYKVTCDFCKGKGWCPTCNGTGYIMGSYPGGNSGGNSGNDNGSSTDPTKNVSLSLKYEEYYHYKGYDAHYEAKFTVQVSGVSSGDVNELGFDTDTYNPPSTNKRQKKYGVTSFTTWVRVSKDINYVRPYVRLYGYDDIYGKTERIDLSDMQ